MGSPAATGAGEAEEDQVAGRAEPASPGLACGVLIRQKRATDAADCLRLLHLVHAGDGYPLHLAPDEVPAFFSSEDEQAAWVAELQGQVVGHVALHWSADDPTLAAAAAATGLPVEDLYLVARLFTAPAVRGTGWGRVLLRHAVSQARARGRRAVLDVGQSLLPAVGLYESEGWIRIGALHPRIDDSRALDLWVYVSPVPR